MSEQTNNLDEFYTDKNDQPGYELNKTLILSKKNRSAKVTKRFFYKYYTVFYFSSSFQTRALAPTMAASPNFNLEGKIFILS